MSKPPKGAKAFAVRIEMDLVIIANDEQQLGERVMFDIARQQYQCAGPFLSREMVKVKRILCKEDIPEGWDDAFPWNDDDADLYAEDYIPSPLEALAEEAE